MLLSITPSDSIDFLDHNHNSATEFCQAGIFALLMGAVILDLPASHMGFLWQRILY
jgi:hypothetical protein